MDWEILLNDKRFRHSSTEKYPTDARNAFENDYSRMILSPHVRRLQNKAQVFPLDDTDFTRTRLTHSLEVSHFAHSLGAGVEKILIKNKKLDNKFYGFIPSILLTAGLVHDIGNPPFGHFGEDTIKKYFSDHFKNHKDSSNYSAVEKSDFTNFDGNAQGFRILRKLGLSNDTYSYNLSFPTLAAMIKYPCSSEEGNKKNSEDIRKRKFGYFQTEKDDYKIISDELGLNGFRHPLTFLLEAADDIAYSVCDIEDGYRKRIITIDLLEETLNNSLEGTENANFIQIFKNYKTESAHEKHLAKNDLLIQKFRIKVQSTMLTEVTNTFIEKHDEILSGQFNKELLSESKVSSLRECFKKLSVYNFQHRSVLKRELVGERVISFLLNSLIPAMFSDELKNGKSKEAKLYQLISPNYKNAFENFSDYKNESYKRIQLVTDFVCGMTDSFALNLFKELNGYEL